MNVLCYIWRQCELILFEFIVICQSFVFWGLFSNKKKNRKKNTYKFNGITMDCSSISLLLMNSSLIISKWCVFWWVNVAKNDGLDRKSFAIVIIWQKYFEDIRYWSMTNFDHFDRLRIRILSDFRKFNFIIRQHLSNFQTIYDILRIITSFARMNIEYKRKMSEENIHKTHDSFWYKIR